MTRRFCIVCGGIYAIKKDKTLRKHKRFLGSSGYGGRMTWEQCPGAGLEGTTSHRMDDGTWPQSPGSITQAPATPGEL